MYETGSNVLFFALSRRANYDCRKYDDYFKSPAKEGFQALSLVPSNLFLIGLKWTNENAVRECVKTCPVMGAIGSL